MKLECLCIERNPEVSDQFATLSDRVIHLTIVEAGFAGMRGFGAVHGKVRLGEKHVGVEPVMRGERDADVG